MEEFFDPELGKIVIIRNSRARRLIARRKADFIQLTVPSIYSLTKIKTLLDEIRPKLITLKPKPVFLLDEDTRLQSITFQIKIERGNLQNYYSSLKNGILHIICPSTTIFTEEDTQIKIRSIIEKTLRFEAKHYLPQRINDLANEWGFKYTEVKINKSRTRWGSCSSRKSINLSLYCMFLPTHLADFVILHELCHTVEMNHGERFWKLLDSVTNNCAKQLTRELKEVTVEW